MSKRQEKIAQKQQEAKAFIAARRAIQVGIFEQNFEAGLRIYEAQKPNLSQEEIDAIEAQIAENKALIQKLKDEANTDAQA